VTDRAEYLRRWRASRGATKDPFGVFDDDEWDELHRELGEIAKRRRLTAGGDLPMAEIGAVLREHAPHCGVIGPGWRRLCDVMEAL
jgi:hypothetical protein